MIRDALHINFIMMLKIQCKLSHLFQAHFRYAQAFFKTGQLKRAIEVNRKGRKICVVKKDLDVQFERFENSGNPAGKYV